MATQYQNGGWYDGKQYWNGQFGAPGQIINPNQQGAGQQVSAAVNQQSSIAQGKAPNAIQNYLAQQTAQPGGGGGGAASGGAGGGAVSGNGDMLSSAQSLLDFQKQANQPIVGALQTQGTNLQNTYNNLLASIKGNQQYDINNQVKATNTELGNRGIGPDSGLYQQTLASAQVPIDQQYGGVYANAANDYYGQSSQLALQLAQAQAGDPQAAIQNALSLGQFGLQQQLLPAQQAYYNRYSDPSGYYQQKLDQTGGGAGGNYLYSGQNNAAQSAGRYQLIH